MFIKYGSDGPLPRSEIVVDFIEDAAIGELEVGNATRLIEDSCVEVANVCITVQKERLANAGSVICGLTVDHVRDETTRTVVIGAGCEDIACFTRSRIATDPGAIVVENAYPIIIENYKNRY